MQNTTMKNYVLHSQLYQVVAPLLVFLVFWIFLAVLAFFIARRKGKGLVHIVIGSFPLWGSFWFFWLISLTDKSVLDRLSRLEGDG
jgi:hypothetical protein